jgi:hypothetical protein
MHETHMTNLSHKQVQSKRACVGCRTKASNARRCRRMPNVGVRYSCHLSHRHHHMHGAMTRPPLHECRALAPNSRWLPKLASATYTKGKDRGPAALLARQHERQLASHSHSCACKHGAMPGKKHAHRLAGPAQDDHILLLMPTCPRSVRRPMKCTSGLNPTHRPHYVQCCWACLTIQPSFTTLRSALDTQ